MGFWGHFGGRGSDIWWEPFRNAMTADLCRLVKKLWRYYKYPSLYTRQKITKKTTTTFQIRWYSGRGSRRQCISGPCRGHRKCSVSKCDSSCCSLHNSSQEVKAYNSVEWGSCVSMLHRSPRHGRQRRQRTSSSWRCSVTNSRQVLSYLAATSETVKCCCLDLSKQL